MCVRHRTDSRNLFAVFRRKGNKLSKFTKILSEKNLKNFGKSQKKKNEKNWLEGHKLLKITANINFCFFLLFFYIYIFGFLIEENIFFFFKFDLNFWMGIWREHIRTFIILRVVFPLQKVKKKLRPRLSSLNLKKKKSSHFLKGFLKSIRIVFVSLIKRRPQTKKSNFLIFLKKSFEKCLKRISNHKNGNMKSLPIY